jgi:hypothetical protein
MSDDRAPRWLVRWLVTLALFVVIAGEGYFIWWELTLADRIAADMQGYSCAFARQVAAMQTDLLKGDLLTANARRICLQVP